MTSACLTVIRGSGSLLACMDNYPAQGGDK